MRLAGILLFAIGCGSNASVDNGGNTEDAQASLANEKKTVQVTVSPGQATVAPGQQLLLKAHVTGTSDTEVTWQADFGSIDADGTFTAPKDEGTYEVTARHSKGAVGRANIVVSAKVPAEDAGDKSNVDLTGLPQTCHRDGQSLMRVSMRVDAYKGTQNGYNGTHELVQGEITQFAYNENPSVIDTHEVQVAMNVQSNTDSSGLPHEIPLAAGAIVEIQGVYIPDSATSSLSMAVLHFTHAPCGYVIIDGAKYE